MELAQRWIEDGWLCRGVTLPQPELVAMRVAAKRKPASSRHRHLLVDLPPEFGDADDAGVDVVDREVWADAALVGLEVRDCRTLIFVNTGQQILG
jgi:hypothetical protein